MTNKEKTTIDQLSGSYGASGRFDVDKGLSRLHRELGIEAGPQAQPQPLKVTSRRSWLAIAASLAVLLAFSFYYATSLDKNTYLADAGNLTVALPDGSEAILKEGSQLRLSADYGENDRTIYLDGEAYFSIEPDAVRPFLVSQDDVELRVVGTTFNLFIDPSTNVFEVEVSSGKVMLEKADESLAIAANECGIVSPAGEMKKMASPNLNRHAWKTGRIVFEATLFSEAVDVIQRTYDVIIKVSDRDLDGCNFPLTATFDDSELDDVLAHLEKLTGGKFLREQSGKVYRLIDWCK